MKGLIISSSILKGLLPPGFFHLKKVLNMNFELKAFPGFDLKKLLGTCGVLHKFLEAGGITNVIIACGSNDISQSLKHNARDIALEVTNTFTNLLNYLQRRYPTINFFKLPVPIRSVCRSSLSDKYPQNELAKECI